MMKTTMQMRTNNNFRNTDIQINAIIAVLFELGLVIENNPTKKEETCENSLLTWNNHFSSREVSSNNFNSITQYLAILSSNSYQLLLKDYSIVRFCYKFKGSKLVEQNLLWWPCPVDVEDDLLSEDLSLIDAIKLILEDNSNKELIRMRTPIRFDYDERNDSESHPKAHVHLQHFQTRLNSEDPLCFGSFMKFICDTSYPDVSINFKSWPRMQYNYGKPKKRIDYKGKSRIVIAPTGNKY